MHIIKLRGCLITRDDRWTENGDWQVIFKTTEGLDYCRETICAAHTLDEVSKWADARCHYNNDLGGAHIEKWGGAPNGDTPYLLNKFKVL